MTNVYCFDVNFHKCTLLESYFIYVGDVEEFRQQCDKETISDYGVRKTGCYFWNDASESWCPPTANEEEKIMRAIEGIGGINNLFNATENGVSTVFILNLLSNYERNRNS